MSPHNQKIYAATYGVTEKIEELLPYMIAAFLDADSGFKKARRDLTAAPDKSTRPLPHSTISGDK